MHARIWKCCPPAITGGADLSTLPTVDCRLPIADAPARTAAALTLSVLLMLGLLVLSPINSLATTRADKRRAQRPSRTQSRSLDRAHSRQPTRAELKEADGRLREMGYGTGRFDGVVDDVTRISVIAFQKWEGREITGKVSRDDFEAIMNASAPRARDTGYKHVEVDVDRQVLLLTDEEGAVKQVLPVSSGSNKHYKEKRMSGLAYTPRGRFRIYAKIAGWRQSPLGLLYYPNYFSDGLAIHGNPSVPSTPKSHGCIRIPMSAAVEVSRSLPLGTIVLIYDRQSFVSAKEWAEADKQKQAIR